MNTMTLVQQCAPTMARLKTGSLFTCAFPGLREMREEIRNLNRILVPRGLVVLPLRYCSGRGLIYMYRPGMLREDLKRPEAAALLKECGYRDTDPVSCIRCLIGRLSSEEEFPHEIGLFLGYPPEDVDGFIHRRDECLCCGLWKVYGNVDHAMACFERCRKCTCDYLERCREGQCLVSLVVAS